MCEGNFTFTEDVQSDLECNRPLVSMHFLSNKCFLYPYISKVFKIIIVIFSYCTLNKLITFNNFPTLTISRFVNVMLEIQRQ